VSKIGAAIDALFKKHQAEIEGNTLVAAGVGAHIAAGSMVTQKNLRKDL
jgi:hypothetical protein